MISTPLNRTSAPIILRFFDTCFKQGVIDAYELGDDYEAEEFLAQKRADWSFGLLGKAMDMDWQAFRFTLYWWARNKHMSYLADSYLFNVRRKGHLWCFLPYCMRFYLMGVEEWLAYPEPSRLELFKGKAKVHWNPKLPSRQITINDIITYMHDFAYEFRRLPEEAKPISSASMDGFCLAVFDLSRKYNASKK